MLYMSTSQFNFSTYPDMYKVDLIIMIMTMHGICLFESKMRPFLVV